MAVLLVLNNLVGAASASGAFEVVDTSTGRTLYSKLATGQIPSVAQVLAVLPASPNAAEKDELQL